MIISVNKSLILIINTKNSPTAGTLIGDYLKGGQSLTARCAGAKLRRKNTKFYKKYFTVFAYFYPIALAYTHP